MATILDGKQVSKDILSELADETKKLASSGVVPGLAAVLIGDNPASKIYVSSKAKACNKIGFYSEVIERPKDFSQKELLKLVDELNSRDDIHGILVQEPLPPQLNSLEMILLMDPAKDVDGFHPVNVGKMLLGHDAFIACTPKGIIELLERYDINLAGKHAVVLGRGNIVGKPLSVLLSLKNGANATVTLCHTGTRDTEEHTKRADLIVAAMGKAEFLTGDMIKDGAVIVDVGINRIDDATKKKGYRIVGDVDFESCEKKASYITPVPGGVGPMTIAMLLSNTLQACKRLHSLG